MKPKPPKDLWAAMDAITGAPPKDDPGYTASEYAARHRITYGTAMTKLTNLAQQGKLIMGHRKHPRTGMPTKVFRPA